MGVAFKFVGVDWIREGAVVLRGTADQVLEGSSIKVGD